MAKQVFPYRLRKEMGFTHNEILRWLPILAGDLPTRVEGLRIMLGDESRHVLIVMEDERDRHLNTAWRVPYTPLEIVYHGYTEEERIRFQERFDRTYFKGGG
jgi:hypothetical protein